MPVHDISRLKVNLLIKTNFSRAQSYAVLLVAYRLSNIQACHSVEKPRKALELFKVQMEGIQSLNPLYGTDSEFISQSKDVPSSFISYLKKSVRIEPYFENRERKKYAHFICMLGFSHDNPAIIITALPIRNANN
jgi:hypothetical protein